MQLHKTKDLGTLCVNQNVKAGKKETNKKCIDNLNIFLTQNINIKIFLNILTKYDCLFAKGMLSLQIYE